jgi:hypothetical protein
MVPTTRATSRAYRCRRLHQAGECPEPAHVGQWIEEYVTSTVKAIMADRGYRFAQSSRRIEQAEREVEEAERDRDNFATATAGMAPEDIRAGMTARVERVHATRRALAEARAASVPVPGPKNFADAFDSLPVEQRRHVLRASLGGVVVRKGAGPDPERVRILEPGATVPLGAPVDFDGLDAVAVHP